MYEKIMKSKNQAVQFCGECELTKFAVIWLSLLTLQACSHNLTKADKGYDDSRYFADASECYQTALKKEQLKLNLSGSKDHPFGPVPITIDIPITYDAGLFKNCMIYAGHKLPKVDADPTAYMELSKKCLDEAKGQANSNEAYANCIKNGDITVDVIETKKEHPKKK